MLALLLGAAMLLTTRLEAQEASPVVLRPGDGIVTGFAGVRLAEQGNSGDSHPLDHTFIDPDGTTVQVLDLARLGGPAHGQLAEPAVRLRLKARDVGHVFGIAFDPGSSGGTPAIYLAASSLFGLPIVVPGSNGASRRAIAGAAGATFMAGLFGPGGGPTSVWKVDGRSGRAIRLANAGSGVAGLGGLAFDAASGSLYVADLGSGLIRRLTRDGRQLDTYDHGTGGRPKAGLAAVPAGDGAGVDITSATFRSDAPETWGYAQRERLVFAVAIAKGRLFYSVAEGPQIWSVGLAADGAFRDDARLEIDVTGTPAGALVTGLTFDGAGNLYIAQRGAILGSYDFSGLARSREAVVARYRWLEGERRWVTALEEYGVGLAGDHRSATGGIALGYGYDRNGLVDRQACNATVWASGEHLRDGEVPGSIPSGDTGAPAARPAGELPGQRRVIFSAGGPRIVHGIQGMPSSRVRPESDPPIESWFVDLDGRFQDADVAGHAGNIAIFAPACAGVAAPDASVRDVAGGAAGPGGAAIEATARCRPAAFGGRAVCTFDIRNVGTGLPAEDVVVRGTSRVLYGPDAGKSVPIDQATPDGADWSCTRKSGEGLVCRLPASALQPGRVRAIEVAMDSRAMVGRGNMGIRSCLDLAHPNGHRHVCAEAGIELAVRKTGPAECAADAACRYAFTIANNSPVAFSGSLVLADRTTIDGKTVTLPIEDAEGLACEGGAPRSDPFVCRTTVSLAPGESRTHWVSLRMRAPGGYWLQTCFGALDPALLADPDLIARITVIGGQGGAHPSCVWTRVPRPPEQIRTSTLIPLLPPVCTDGRRRLADGRCACPLSAPWDKARGACIPVRPVCADATRTRDDGTCCPTGLVWLAGQGICGRPPEICPDPRRRMADGGCCGFGYVWSWNDGRCVPPFARCPDGRPVPPSGFCGCPSGTVWSTHARRCVTPPQACPDLSRRRPDGSCCGLGTRWSTFASRCVPVDSCSHGQQRPDGGCCPSGTTWSTLLRRCQSPDTPPPCPTGQHRVGTRCVPDGPPPCPSGQHRLGHRCVPDGPPPCPSGQHRVGTRCVPDGPPPCPTGQHRVGTRCVPDGPPPCPRGQHRVGSRCVPIVIPRKDLTPSRKLVPTRPPTKRGTNPNRRPNINIVPIPRLNIPSPGGLPRLPGGFR